MQAITLKKNEDKRVRNGHPWIFSNEIASMSLPPEAGMACQVFDHQGKSVGYGYLNHQSLIAVRMVATSPVEIDSVDFFVERLTVAHRERMARFPGIETYRLIYGESDHLPGLVVDVYGRYVSLQLLTAGMDRRRDLIVAALKVVLNPVGIIARNDVAVRRMEGLEEEVVVLDGTIPPTIIMEENGLRFEVDLTHGQKTGGFLDQKDNHKLLKPLSPGAEVLDCFCYSGSWGVHAAAYGAKQVLCLDISERAISHAGRNAALNGVEDRMAFEAVDVFERLRSLEAEGRRFDLIILDPPAFVKNKRQLAEATKGYLTINRRALSILKPGGYLITCSCSYHMGREAFRDLLAQAARLARREVCLEGSYGQASDHPVLVTVPESDYLKCLVLRAR